MLRYIARRLLLSVPLLVGISLVSFLMMHMAPGGPIGAGTDLNPKATAESRARLRAYYGLDQPLHVQYWRWLGRMATLDFGNTFSPDRRPVAEKILERMPITLTINVLSMGLHLPGRHSHRVFSRRAPGVPLRPDIDRRRLHRVRHPDLLARPAGDDPLRGETRAGSRSPGSASLDYDSFGAGNDRRSRRATWSCPFCWRDSGGWRGCRGTCGRTCSR